jgi:hypothetical protein
MRVTLKTDNVQTIHNNKAPGLLRVMIEDHRPAPKKAELKLNDIKKAPEFRKAIKEYMNKGDSEINFRFNKHCGILIQDALNKFQNANVPQITAVIDPDEQLVLPEPAVAAPVVEVVKKDEIETVSNADEFIAALKAQPETQVQQ